jgi:hypothetical protein
LTNPSISNVEEHVLTLVNRGCKIIAPRASEIIFTKKSGKRSENIILVATNIVILATMIICTGVRMNEELPEKLHRF